MCLTEWLFFPLPILNFGAGCASNYTSERHALRAIRKVVKAYPQIPIILVILMDYEESRIRLLKMKKKARRASLLSSIYSHSVFELPSLYRGEEIVPRDLKPYLDLVKDLIFKGFPMV